MKAYTDSPVRFRDDLGFEYRCPTCRTFWPLSEEFWYPRRGCGGASPVCERLMRGTSVGGTSEARRSASGESLPIDGIASRARARSGILDMSRDDGFAVMDVSTDLVNDPKIRKLYRHAPDHADRAVVAYVATMCESWKAGKRVTIDDAWPGFVPFDKPAVEALAHVGLIDRTGRVTLKAWKGWYEPARERREKSRDRWARYNANRHGDTTFPPRGSDVDTATSVPPVRPSPPGPTGASVPPARARGEKNDVPKARTKEEALLWLSEEFRAGKIDELTYTRQRKALTA